MLVRRRMPRSVLAVLGIAIVCIVLAGWMLVTGYIPPNGFGAPAEHHARFALVMGVGIGSLWAVLLRGLLDD